MICQVNKSSAAEVKEIPSQIKIKPLQRKVPLELRLGIIIQSGATTKTEPN